MEIKVMEITPEIAKELLKNNKSNRNIVQNAVNRYARDMEAGNWEQNGDTITIDEKGNLTDGQHRLSAIVQSGVTVKMIVVSGIGFSATKDIGKPRSVADSIKMQYGISAMDNKVMGNLNMIAIYSGLGAKLTPSEYVKLYNYFEDELLFVRSIPNVWNVPCPVQSAAVVVIKELGYSRETAKRFLSAFEDGFIDGEEEYAAVALKNWLRNVNGSAHGSARKLLFRTTIGALIAFAKKNPSKRVAKPKDIDLENLKYVVFGNN